MGRAAMSAFRDDPKIDKIIRALQKQIARDSYHLSSFSGALPGDNPRETIKVRGGTWE